MYVSAVPDGTWTEGVDPRLTEALTGPPLESDSSSSSEDMAKIPPPTATTTAWEAAGPSGASEEEETEPPTITQEEWDHDHRAFRTSKAHLQVVG